MDTFGTLTPRGRFVTSALVSIALALTPGCGSPSDELPSGDGDGGGDGDNGTDGPTTFVETEGGMDLPIAESTQGSVTLVGASDAVPSANRSFSGFRDPENDGEELVRCNYYPQGNADYPSPHLEILAGFQGRLYYQAQAQIFVTTPGEEVELPLGADDSLEEGTQELIFIAALTHESEEGAYRYWYGVDEFAHPPYGSDCSVTLAELGETASGSVNCSTLIATPDSPDAPVTHAPYPNAQVTMQFDCPVVNRDPRFAEISKETDGTCSGSPSACILLDSFECSVAPGCSPTGSCSGSARTCDDYFEFYSCEGQQGCFWSGFECYGFPDSCFSFDGDKDSCLWQSGCDWRDDCDGDAIACQAFGSQATCEAQGCFWEN